ncbi:MAG TPA: dihydrofolate reductase [Candidatus Limnocylindrales bacterium]|nr:dihydrofolate reductase [Candidatus Limnocylindrales bacterium]
MIRFIAALDSKRGIANEQGIPWQGKIPADVKYYHQKIKGAATIMGYGMYTELSKPLVNPTNFVASQRGVKLRDGFLLVEDATEFLQKTQEDVWVLGGAALFASTLDLADELYLTQLHADFDCTKFFPIFQPGFTLVQKGADLTQNGITFHFEVWKRIKRA